MRTGFGVQGGANKIKRYKPLSPEKERRAGSQRVAPPENEKSTPNGVLRSLEAPPRIELGIEVLQTFALPLGHGAIFRMPYYYSKVGLVCQAFFYYF